MNENETKPEAVEAEATAAEPSKEEQSAETVANAEAAQADEAKPEAEAAQTAQGAAFDMGSGIAPDPANSSEPVIEPTATEVGNLKY